MKAKRLLAFAMSMLMILSILPLGALASNETDEMISVSGQFIVDNFLEGTAEKSVEIQIYSETAENTFYYDKARLGDNNTWSIDVPAVFVGDYSLLVMPISYGNVFPGEYEYVDESGIPIEISLNGEDVSGINVELPTGRMISGTVELTDDIVLPDTPVECSIYAGVHESENSSTTSGSAASYDDYFANIMLRGKSTPFDLVVDYEVKSIVLSARPWVSGTETNLLSNVVFYVDNSQSTEVLPQATIIETTSDVSGFKLYPASGNMLNVKLIRPESITQRVSGTLKLLDESGAEITYQYFQLYEDGYQVKNFNLSKEYGKVYIYFKAAGNYSSSFGPYNDWLYYNPDGTFSKTMDEAKPHTLEGLTNLEFTVPDEDFYSPRIKGKLCFDEDVIAENVSIDVIVTPKEGSAYSKTVFDNTNGKTETKPLSDGREFEFVFPEGSGLETQEYYISVDFTRYEGASLNVYANNRYYYSKNGCTVVEEKADAVLPSVSGDAVVLNIPTMKTVTGKIISDGEFKSLNEKSIARIIFRCAHEDNNSGSSSGTVTPFALTEYTESDCILSYYETEAIINKDLTFTCLVPEFMTGEHTVQLIIEQMGTNLLPGWYYYTDNSGEDILIPFNGGETDEEITFNVKTGYTVSGVVKMPTGGTFEPTTNVKKFVMDLRLQRVEYTNYDSYRIELSDTVREVPFMLVVDKSTALNCRLYSFPQYGWDNTNLNQNTLYYIDDKLTTENENDAKTFSVNGDIENVVFNLKLADGVVVEPETTETFFIVLDKDTKSAIPNAMISLANSTATGSSEKVTLATGSDGNAAYATLESGTYIVVTSADGYVTDNQTVEISGNAKEVVIELEKIEFSIEDNTTFCVKDGDLESTPAIPGASLTIEDTDGNIITKTTDFNGNATAELENGTYYVTAIATDYKTRSFKIEKTDSNNNFTVYLNKDDIVQITSTVKELTPDEMKEAGIDTDAIGNKQVYNCTAVLSFIPDVKINYYYTNDGKVIKGNTPITHGNLSVTPVGRDIYLIVKSTTSWLKEIFEVQIICDNTSAVETIEDLIADLTIPEGLSLAIMSEGEQTEDATLGDIAPRGNASHKWYICGDVAGEYTLNGTLKGTRTGGGISEDMELTFGIEDSLTVLAGDAMTLTIDAESHGRVGYPYFMRYTLENVSNKTLYDLSFSVFGGKFFEDYKVIEAKYAKEYGPDAIEDLNGKGFIFETDEFKPGDKISGLFEITFGEELSLGKGQEWVLKDAFVVTGAGSTTVIPTTINWLSYIPEHNWDDGTVTKAATCTEDGIMTFSCLDVDCGKSYTDRIPATGHKMGDFVTTNPTCTSEGSETSSCQNNGCDHSVVLPIAALGHDWATDFTVDSNPTCEEAGSKSIHCTRCNETKDVTEIPALSHDYGDWQTRTPATCTAAGEKYHTCSKCGDEETEAIAQLGHDWATDYTVDVEPTCTTEGSKSKHCTRCSEKTDIQSVPVLDHNWDNGKVTTPSTEETEGEKTYTCTDCGATKTEKMPVLVKQLLEFARIGDVTMTYGQFKYVDNMAYNDSENGSALVYTSSNTEVATVDENGRATITGTGETIITATAAATEIYVETSISYKLTVNKAELTITPEAAEVFYGDAPVLSKYTAEGFVYDEDTSVLTGEAVFETEYKQFGIVGTYTTSVSGLSAKNYNITYANGTLTVKKAVDYVITIENLTQRKGHTEAVVTSISPKDDSAVIKVEYKIAEDTWSESVPTEIGDYTVRASLISADNIAPKADYYNEAILSVKAGAMINIDGDSDVSIDTKVDGNKVEFNITDEDVENIINNLPSNGEVVIDAKGNTNGVNELTLPSNIINALDENENAKSLTVLADDAEITMDSKVLETVSDKVSQTDKVSIHIDAVEKEALNNKQQEALDSLGGDNAVILQLNLVVTSYENGVPVNEQVHQLNGKVDVRAAYTLPADMEGKRILVCYVADDGSVSYVRAKYDNGFVSFTTNHFSHYAIVARECPHSWDNGIVVTPATTTSTGIKRYTCSLCDTTKDEVIPKEELILGGGGGAAAPTTYTITFETNGGSKISPISVKKNALLTKPADPVKDGYTFAGWFTNEGFTKPYDFTTKVAKSFTLYAKWSKIQTEPEGDKPEAPEVKTGFADVKESDWFYANVKFVVDNKLMNGVSATKFAPNANITRAMLVTVLYRNEGEPATSKNIPFSDVDMSAYYANAIAWAKQNGIVNGVTENEFAPNANITREQIAAIMFRYAKYKGMNTATLEENLSYADADKISEYAVSAMNWAVGSGLMNGKTATTLNPADTATRAEIAAILQRFIENK